MHLVSLPQVLVRWAAEAPERPARAPEGRTLTRGEFHRPATGWCVSTRYNAYPLDV